MRDPEHYESPGTFWPERYIDESEHFIKDERVIPIGIGKCYCLGQSLAEKEFFLFFTGVLKRFRFRPVPGLPLPGYGRDDVEFAGAARNPPSNLRVLATDRMRL